MKMEGGNRIQSIQLGSTKKSPLISVITIVYNGAALIEGTIQSVLKQNLNHVEYIIIDGASKDHTVEIIKKYESQIDYWVSEPDKGIYDAMNKGLQAATGDYVWFMNAGDHVHDASIVQAIVDLKSNADVFYGEANFVDEARNLIGTRSQISTRKLPEHLKTRDMLYGMAVCHQSFIAKRSLTSLYDTQYRCSADIDWVINVLKKSKTVVNTKLVLSDYLVGGFSIQHKKLAWKERSQIYTKQYGWALNLWATFLITLRYAAHKLKGKKNY
jgi:glycosyltransferase involved in cell wall biosynthesis